MNPFGIGDVLFSTPVIENVKAGYPGVFIGYLCNARTAPMFKNNHKVDKVFIYEKDDWRNLWKGSKAECIISFIRFLLEIKKYKFDLAIDLSLGRHYSFFLWLLGVKKRYGFNYKRRGVFLTDRINIEGYEGKHVIEHQLDLLRFMGLRPGQIKPRIYINDECNAWANNFLKNKAVVKNSGHFIIGIVPGGGVSWGKSVDIRRWPKEKFAQLADKIIDAYSATVIIFGDKSESSLCNDVVSFMMNKPISVVGETDLMQFAALLSKCNLVVANDGGPLHLSVAVGVKTVSLFGPVDEKVYGQYPPDANMHRIIKNDLDCRPCYRKFRMPPCDHNKECLNAIAVDKVFRAIGELL